MSSNPHPHVSWRDGKPRFQPSKTLREQGHEGRDLRHEDGRWYTKGEAVDWSIQFQQALSVAKVEPKVTKSRGILVPRAQIKRARSLGVTVGELYNQWQHPIKGSVRFRDGSAEAIGSAPFASRKRKPIAGQEKNAYAPRTRQDIKQKLGLVELDHPEVWASPVDALTQPVLFGLYEEMVATRGLGQARGAIAWLSAMFSWGRKRGKCTFSLNHGENPAKGLGMATPPPRVRFGTRNEIHALIAAADRLGMPEIGDMIVLGVWTGQRQGDRLFLLDKGTLNGRRIFRQRKTGAIVAIKQSPELTSRLKKTSERRKAAGVVSPYVVLNEKTWQPYGDDGDLYRKRFAEVRAEAAKFVPSLLGKGREDNKPFYEMDLRDTSVTWQALAGVTIPEICNVTGHALEGATRILKHYLASHPEMADTAIAKMVEWYEGDGETEIGL